MYIAKIKIENFRSIKNLEIDLSQICALVGQNNAGKSNILMALQKVLARDWVTVNVFDEDDRKDIEGVEEKGMIQEIQEKKSKNVIDEALFEISQEL